MTAVTLLLLGLIFIMMMPNRRPANRQERQEEREAARLEVEQAWANFVPESMSSLSLRPYEKAFAELERREVGNFTQLLALEEEFNLPKHTLSKFLDWKKKVPAALPSDATKSKADMMAAKRAREAQELASAEKKQAHETESMKMKAAAAIAQRHKHSLDEMMSEAITQSMDEAAYHDISLEEACKRVCVARRSQHVFSAFTPHRF
jgi:hypothetical protein